MRKQIVLLFSVLLTSAGAYAHTVTGKIIGEEDQLPVVGATIQLKGSNQHFAVSNVQGQYSIIIPNENGTLIFKYLGFSDKEVPVDGRTVIDVVLSSTSTSLDQVVVTGYKDVSKGSFTGSSVKVLMDDLKMPGATDVSRMLEGKVAGVSIQNVSNTFGTAPKVRVRGVTSLNGVNKPLWVVDGVELTDVIEVSNDQLSSGDPTTLLGSSVAGLSSSDIESMTILKDAAATALYGARAMNGVIVITTKRGKTGKTKVTYDANFTVRQKPRYEDFDIMNSIDQMTVYAELDRKGWLPVDMFNWSSYGPYGKMYELINAYDPSLAQTSNSPFGLVNTPEAKEAYLMRYARANTDWFDLLYTNNILQEHSVSITSGNEKATTYTSISMLYDAGQTIADNVTRYTMNSNNTFRFGDRISATLQFKGSYRSQRAPGSFNRSSDPVRGSYSRNFDINPFAYARSTSRVVRPYDEYGNLEYVQMNYAPFNVLEELSNNWLDLGQIDVQPTAEISVNFINPENERKYGKLSYRFLGSMRYVSSTSAHTITERSNVASAYRAARTKLMREQNPYLWQDPNDPAGEKIVVLTKGGFLNTSLYKMEHYNVRNTLTYSHNINKHEVSMFGGMEIKYTDRFKKTNTAPGYLYYEGQRYEVLPDFARMMADRNTVDHTDVFRLERFVSFFGSLDYTYDQRYSISGSIRYDGSNAMGKSTASRWVGTWTVSGKWNVGEEEFMAPVRPILSALALRGSYGLSASMAPLATTNPLFYNDRTFAPGYTQNMLSLETLGDQNLTWEKKYQLNFAVDYTLLNNRMSGTVEWWRCQSFDLIDQIEDSGIGGQVYKYANFANLKTEGIDVTLNFTPVKTKDWRWNLDITYGYCTTLITNAKNMPNVMNLVSSTGDNKNGYPIKSIFSVPFAGLDPLDGMPRFYQPDGSIAKSYYMQSYNTDALIYEGPVDPTNTGGFNNKLTWKNLSLYVGIAFSWGNVVRLDPTFSDKYTDLRAMSRDFNERWMVPGDEKHTNIPSIVDRLHNMEGVGVYPYNVYNYSDVRIAKGDFARLKTLSLTYTLPQELLAKTKVISNVSLSVTGKDIWLIYADPLLNGQDPEFLNTGGVALPALPQIVFSVNVGF